MLNELFYGATAEGSSFNKDAMLALIKKEEFFSIIWNGSLSRPLNLRWIGSKEEYIKKLSGIISNDYFKRPKWWKSLVADKIGNN